MKKSTNSKKKKEINLHKMWLHHIKSECKNLTFFSFMTDEKGEHYVKIILTNFSKGKDTVLFKMECLPTQMKGKDYEYILSSLKERTYESSV